MHEDLTLRGAHARRAPERAPGRAAGACRRPPRAGQVSAAGERGAAVVVIVLLAIFALDALLKVLVAVALGLVVAYGIAELLRLAGVGVGRPRPIAPTG